jgi:endoglucanase
VALSIATFAPGQTAQTVSASVNGDVTMEKNETVNLALSAATGATISDVSGVGTIINDD